MRFLVGLLCVVGLLRAEVLETETWRLFKETITFSGHAQEDFFVQAVNEVSLEGQFDEDLWAAGRKVTFKGSTGDDARLLGIEFVSVEGLISGNLRGIAYAGNVLVNTNAVVKGDAMLEALKRVNVHGRIEGDLRIESPKAIVEAEILGNLIIHSTDIQLLPGTLIHGDLLNYSKQDLPLPEGVQVLGERQLISENPEASQMEKDLLKMKWAMKGLQFVSAFLIGLTMLRLLPRFTGQNVDLLLHHRQPALSLGMMSVLVFGIVGYLLIISVIGMGVGIFLILITSILFYLGKIMVAYAVGMSLLRQKENLSFGKLALALLIGLVVLYSAFSIVYIGGALYFMSSCWGLGAILTCIRQSQRAIKIQIPPPLKKSQG